MATSNSRPQAGEHAPDFALPDARGALVRLGDLLGKGPVVLYFYPKDETSGCTVEACAFRDAYADFRAAGAEVVGVSRDGAEAHARFASKHSLGFVLLSDAGGEVHARYRIRRHFGLINDRVTFVIDQTGVIRFVFDSKRRFTAHVSEALAVVRGLADGRTP